MPGYIHKPGKIGIVSRSGTLTYEAVKVPGNTSFEYDVVKMSKQNLVKFFRMSIKPCWITRPSRNGWEESKGFIIFSLTGGPEYHVSQIEIVYDYGKEAEAL